MSAIRRLQSQPVTLRLVGATATLQASPSTAPLSGDMSLTEKRRSRPINLKTRRPQISLDGRENGRGPLHTGLFPH